MEIKIIYSKKQLDAAVDFIGDHNENFRGQYDYIRDRIVESMEETALAPGEWITGTMGYVLWGDREDEGLDSDENVIRYSISVDPALALEAWDLDDMVEYSVSDIEKENET
jgi:hypothetical protein